MKKITLLAFIVLLSTCNSAKRIKKEISKGNYEYAIKLAVKKLHKNNYSKKKQEVIVLLENVYKKAVDTDNRSLNRLILELKDNPSAIENIYETYVALDKRQNLIRPILPLYIKNEGRDAIFNFVDYTNDLVESKASLSEYLYANAKRLLVNSNKENARKAYDDLEYLDRINPNYKKVKSLLKEAHFKGTNFVEVVLKNQTNQVIPKRLEDSLLDFDSYGLDKFWTAFHTQKNDRINYDYQLALLFKRIDVSPEQIIEKQIPISREIEDGFEYVLDDNGHVALDSLGNSIKVPKIVTVKADIYKIHQEKASRIAGDVVLTNLHTNQEMDKFPLESEFIFLYNFAEMDGDIRALNNEERELIKLREIPFPSNEQMIFDTGEDLKKKLKRIIKKMNI